MKITPIVLGDIPLMAIRYKWRFQKGLGFVAKEGGGINQPGVPYLHSYPENYSNFSMHPFLCPRVIGRYLSACNAIDNHNMIRQSDPALDKYWVTQSDFFRLTTTVAFGMGIKYGKLLFCHEI